MKQQLMLLFIGIISFGTTINAQFRKIDTTMKIGKAGYKVICSNKSETKNSVSITPIGFQNSARDVMFEVKGRILKAEVDDLNNDVFPDLVLYVYEPGDKGKGNVVGISSINNETFAPISFPDIVNDPKLRIGYAGFDSFLLMEGTLMRRFPVYTTDSSDIKPTGMMRQIQYKVLKDEKEGLKFKPVRSYEYAKQ
ncbi:MAG: hypothetical protein EAZ12_02490 [Sphingobacteriia bacterium]|nr:MAG: hypothetical protein EAZ12_02490 [Sphingobacteriia bacterium]